MAAIKAGSAYTCALLCIIAALAASALGDDADLKKQVEQMAFVYGESYNKQDAVTIAAQYASGGLLVTPAGARNDIKQMYEAEFNAGFHQSEVKVDEVLAVGSDTAIGIGTYRNIGKIQSGAPIEVAGRWTATFVREGGKWKIRMLTSLPQPK